MWNTLKSKMIININKIKTKQKILRSRSIWERRLGIQKSRCRNGSEIWLVGTRDSTTGARTREHSLEARASEQISHTYLWGWSPDQSGEGDRVGTGHLHCCSVPSLVSLWWLHPTISPVWSMRLRNSTIKEAKEKIRSQGMGVPKSLARRLPHLSAVARVSFHLCAGAIAVQWPNREDAYCLLKTNFQYPDYATGGVNFFSHSGPSQKAKKKKKKLGMYVWVRSQ